LLLWATEEEFAEVSSLLKELGAVASDNRANATKFRVLESRSPEETARVLQQLQKSWNGPNQLNINVPPLDGTKTKKEPAAGQQPATPPATKDKITLNGSSSNSSNDLSAKIFFVAQAEESPDPAAAQAPQPAEQAQAEAKSNEPAKAPATSAPINITMTPDGRIVITSNDVAALDQLEDLLAELEPPQRNFEVFQLHNSRASLVSLNLEEYFKDELGDDNSGMPWWWDEAPKNDEPATLGKRRKLRFIWDNDTNTIVVQNASPAQLQVIHKLVEIYDQAVSEDAVARRQTDIVQIKYSRAQDIATAIKEVYRDLLSSKDKEFQGKEGDRGGQSRNENRFRFFSSSSDQKSTPVKVSFEGALSIGVDEISNTLIISAEEGIWENIKDLAVSLDEKAKPNTVVQVHELRGSMTAAELKKALATAFVQPWPGGKPLQGAAVQTGK
jgi:type II secretory pathway component GspD/PulD (secretin)